MEDEPLQRIEGASPGRLGEDALRVRIACIPPPADAGRTEVDVLGMVLSLQRRRKLTTKQRAEIAKSVLSGRKSAAEMARLYDVSQPTVSRIVAEARASL